MELTSNLGGTVYLFAGGTGILPFLDLLDYLLKKAIFLAASKKNNSSNIVNLYNENYSETFERSLNVILYGSFATLEDFTGYEFVKKLYEISRDENLRLFDLIIRMGKGVKLTDLPTTEETFGVDFVKKHVEGSKLSRAYICGPPGMNNSVPKALTKIGIPKSKIYIV
jgi:ferredoxin-NADP reductase